MKNIYILFITLIIGLASCKKPNNATIGQGNVIVVNEGGFNHGDASLSLYDPATKVITNNILQAENGSTFNLGDVAQSLCLIGDTAFVVMNNSQKIVVFNAAQNFKFLYNISIPNSSPRFFLPVGGSKAYVTELYNNTIWVIDYRAGTVLKTIPVNGWTEQLFLWSGKVYVQEQTTPGGTPVHAVLEIDPGADQIVNTVSLSIDPGSMALTSSNQLFVLCPQQASPTVAASLYIIDMASFSVTRQLGFPVSHAPGYVRYSTYANKILYADDGIYTMLPTDTVLPASVFIPSANWNLYGLNADPATGDIYVSDALDYQQASSITRFSQSGAQLDHFTAGIITNGFVFE
jgi:DNA-binding beta-propeller fold protein YncE